jgi:hypothetical protein
VVVGPANAREPLLDGVAGESVLPTERGHRPSLGSDQVSEGLRTLGHGSEPSATEAKKSTAGACHGRTN